MEHLVAYCQSFGEGCPQATPLISIKQGHVSQLCILYTAFVSLFSMCLAQQLLETWSFFSLFLIDF